ncbi:MAG: type II secretion system protein [Acidobacteria bacterium]|nr:type II secretion system protein [Acidobacteriota bacterium]
MMRVKPEKGYSLIEILVVIAILAIVMGVAAFSYRTAMRATRVKQGLSDLYDGFVAARSQAIIQNGEISVAYNAGSRSITFTRNGTVLDRIVFSKSNVDPGRQAGDQNYHFEKYTVLRSSTREGDTAVTGLDVDGDGSTDNIPFLSAGSVNLTIEQTGFINGVGNASAILVMHQGDIDDNDTSGEREYALVIFSTGLLKRVRHSSTGWELF